MPPLAFVIGICGILLLPSASSAQPTSRPSPTTKQSKNQLFEQGKRPLRGVRPLPHPSPSSHPLSAAQCLPCHKTTFDQWKRSRHALSFTNRHFQIALRDSPYRWCIHCHSPLPEQFDEIRSWLRDIPAPLPTTISARANPAKTPQKPKKYNKQLHKEGINCAVCHIRDGVLLSATPPTPKALKEHPIRHEPRLKDPHFCAGCHQFNLTTALTKPTSLTDTPNQDTYREWQASWARAQGKTCISCHMSKGSHRFPGAHDPKHLKQALQIEVTLRALQEVEVIVKSRRVGHSIPTGDPFRRLLLSVFAKVGDKKALASFTFQKIFRVQNKRWYIWKDDRIPAPTASNTGEKRLTLRLPHPQTSIHWVFDYHYAEFQHHRFLTPSEIRLRIASGHSAYRKKGRK
jgi:mono/diheme cytochrome c family protein